MVFIVHTKAKDVEGSRKNGLHEGLFGIDQQRRAENAICDHCASCGIRIGIVTFLNSWKYSWLGQRAKALAQDDQYAALKLGVIEKIDDKIPPDKIVVVHKFSEALIRGYADNGFPIKIPFFGVVFDVYDLSLLGGLSCSVILLLLRYSINTELSALDIGFRAANTQTPDVVKMFYEVLATRQLLTVPKILNSDTLFYQKKYNYGLRKVEFWIFRVAPKLLVFSLFFIYAVLFINDLITLDIGHTVSKSHAQFHIYYSLAFIIAIFYLSVRCAIRMVGIDNIWDHWYDQINNGKAGTATPAETASIGS